MITIITLDDAKKANYFVNQNRPITYGLKIKEDYLRFRIKKIGIIKIIKNEDKDKYTYRLDNLENTFNYIEDILKFIYKRYILNYGSEK